MKKVRTGIIGSGFMGSAHIEALQRTGLADIKAIASMDKDSTEYLADTYSIPKIYETWEELIDDEEIELIHNCTPNNLHYTINRQAILAGKHILSEKPLTLTSAESEELLQLLQDKPLVNAINFNYRFYPVLQHVKAEIEDGNLGEVYMAHGNYLQDWMFYETDYNWRVDSKAGGASRAVADIGSHWFDMIQFLTGLKVTEVFADLVQVYKTRKRPEGEVETFKSAVGQEMEDIAIDTEDGAMVLFRLSNGAKGTLTISQVSAGRKNHFSLEINGSKKSFSWNQEEANTLWAGYRNKPNELLIKDPAMLNKKAARFAHYPGGHPEGYPDGPKNLFAEVYKFILSGNDPRKEKPAFPTFEDGHTENKVVEAILESSKNEKWIKIK